MNANERIALHTHHKTHLPRCDNDQGESSSVQSGCLYYEFIRIDLNSIVLFTCKYSAP